MIPGNLLRGIPPRAVPAVVVTPGRLNPAGNMLRDVKGRSNRVDEREARGEAMHAVVDRGGEDRVGIGLVAVAVRALSISDGRADRVVRDGRIREEAVVAAAIDPIFDLAARDWAGELSLDVMTGL